MASSDQEPLEAWAQVLPDWEFSTSLARSVSPDATCTEMGQPFHASIRLMVAVPSSISTSSPSTHPSSRLASSDPLA